MDRTLVHTSTEKQKFDISKLKWFWDIPFSSVPEELIKRLGFDYTNYLKWCQLMDALPTYWNIALVYDGEIVLFVWGTFDFLEELMHVVRIVAHPCLYSINGHLLKLVVKECKKVAQDKKIYFISDRWQAFFKKLPHDLKLSEARVLEVKNV